MLASEAAATVAVVKTSGSITGGPVLGRDGQLWMVEASQATGQPMLAAVNPASYAVSTYPLPASLGALSLRYTGAEAFDNVGQLWLGAEAAPAGQQPTGMLVRYLLRHGRHHPLLPRRHLPRRSRGAARSALHRVGRRRLGGVP